MSLPYPDYTLEGSLNRVELPIFRFAKRDENIISAVIGGGNLGLDESKEWVELHFYTREEIPTLVKSVFVPLTPKFLWVRDGITRQQREKFKYQHETIQLCLEFWNAEVVPNELTEHLYHAFGLDQLDPGYYNIIINIFSDELGSYGQNRIWEIGEISDGKRELILVPQTPATGTTTTEINQFADRSMFGTKFNDMLDKFNEPTGTGTPAYPDIVADVFDGIMAGVGGATTMGYIEEMGYTKEVTHVLNSIIRALFIELSIYSNDEMIHNRYRITDNNIEGMLNTAIENILGDIDAGTGKISDFPEPGQLFLNE